MFHPQTQNPSLSLQSYRWFGLKILGIQVIKVSFWRNLYTAIKYVECQFLFRNTFNQGPSHWGEQYNTCKGKHQSPINIKTVDLLYVSMPPLKMVGFKTPPQETSLTNNGHTGEHI